MANQCPIPPYVDPCPPRRVYQVGGSEYVALKLCDTGNQQSILAVYQMCDGVVSGAPTYFDLAGAPYTPVGTVGECGSGVDYEILCDLGTTPKSRVLALWDSSAAPPTLSYFVPAADGSLTPYTPVGPVGACPETDVEESQICYLAVVAGAGYAAGDQLLQILYWDTGENPPTLTATIWRNQTQNTILSAAPPSADLTSCGGQQPVFIPLCDTYPTPCEVGNLIVPANWTFTGVAGLNGSNPYMGGGTNIVSGVSTQIVSVTSGSTYSYSFNVVKGGAGPGTARVLVEVLDGTTVIGTIVRDQGQNHTFAGLIPSGNALTIRITDQTTDGNDVDVEVQNNSLTCVTPVDKMIITPFLRRICVTCGAGSPTVTDLQLDGTTAYTVIGTVGTCAASGNTLIRACDTIVTPGTPAAGVCGVNQQVIDAVEIQDAEEKNPTTGGSAVNVNDNDLEMAGQAEPGETDYKIGVRFTANIPQGATICAAYLQFTAEGNTSTDPFTARIEGENVNNSAPFTAVAGMITARAKTVANVNWSPAAWVNNAAGAAQRTPDLAAIIQEIVNRAGWAANNALALFVTPTTNTGYRRASSILDGSEAVKLHVEYVINGAAVPTTTCVHFFKEIDLATGTATGSNYRINPTTGAWESYTPTGTVTEGDCICPGFSGDAGTHFQILCMEDGSGTEYARVVAIDGNSGSYKVIGNYDLAFAGQYTPIGLSAPCSGKPNPVDVDPIRLCDNNGPFLRHIVYGETGSVSAIFDTQLDGLTAYTVVGAVRDCQARRLVAAIPAHVCSGGVPAGFVGYDFDIPAQFPGATDANDLWLHIIEYPGNVYWIPPATTNPTTPIPVTDPGIQTYINNALALAGFTLGDVFWQVNGDNTITVWYAPTFNPADLPFWSGVSTPDQYTGKEYPQIPTTHQPTLTGGCSTCVEVQIEKYENADGSITEELYEIGTRNLVTLSPGQTLAFGPCPKPEPQPLIIKTGWQVITAPFSLADALALSGGSYISAFTVKQISGVGLVTGDTGSAPLDTAEIWSGSTGNNIDRLSTNIIFDPQSGAMRLMWHYV